MSETIQPKSIELVGGAYPNSNRYDKIHKYSYVLLI